MSTPRSSTSTRWGPDRTRSSWLFAHEVQLDVGAVGQDREHEPVDAEVLEEQGVAELRDQASRSCDDLVEVVVGHDHTQIEVRMLVLLPPGRRACEERRHDPVVGGTGGHETIEDDLTIALPRMLAVAEPRRGAVQEDAAARAIQPLA